MNQEWIERLGDAVWSVRESAAAALLADGAAAVDALVGGLTHRHPRVRAACAALMDHLADDRCVDPLRRALGDPSPTVRRHAVHSLGCQGCKAAPLSADIVGLLAERALEDPSPRVRRVAVHQLGLQPYDPRAVEVLEAILQREMEPGLLSRARFALQNHRGPRT